MPNKEEYDAYMKNKNIGPLRNIPANNMPIYEMPELPQEAYLMMLGSTYVEAYGCNVLAGFRLPINRLVPGGDFQPNVYSLDGKGFMYNVPANKVVPAYVRNGNEDIALAQSTSEDKLAQFLIIANDTVNEGHFLVQTSGIYRFKNGHNYAVGKNYYLGATGFPTTERPSKNAQKLFSVLDKTTIAINIG